MKSMTPSDQAQVRIAVKDVLTSPESSTILEKIMKDPKFAGEFAKAVSKDNKQIHKDLMKDPSYQQELVDMFKTPEMLKILTDSMKTTDVRKLIMSSVTESMENPLFKLEIMKLLQSVVKEELTPDTEKKDEKKAWRREKRPRKRRPRTTKKAAVKQRRKRRITLLQKEAVNEYPRSTVFDLYRLLAATIYNG